jgi:hypothetical protein
MGDLDIHNLCPGVFRSSHTVPMPALVVLLNCIVLLATSRASSQCHEVGLASLVSDQTCFILLLPCHKRNELFSMF